jgi:hypothetical protein
VEEMEVAEEVDPLAVLELIGFVEEAMAEIFVGEAVVKVFVKEAVVKVFVKERVFFVSSVSIGYR